MDLDIHTRQKSVTIIGGAGDNKHIAWLAKLDRNMQHPIIARLRQNVDCRPANLRTSINWAHLGFHQTNEPLHLMDGLNASVTKGLCGVRVGALDCANGNGFHHIIFIK